MTKSTITRERLEVLANAQYCKSNPGVWLLGLKEVNELARMALAALDSEPDRNPVLAYADSYRDMAKQGVESVPIWSVITDLERNIAPLYRHAQQPVVPASQKEPISFDEWSRKCALQITLCYPDFREKAQYIWDSARETQQPAPEYPEVLPCSVLLEPGLRFGKGIKTSTMLSALARRAVHESDMAALSPKERAEFQTRIEDFKALIAQPTPAVPEEITIETATIIAYGLPTTNIGAIFKAGHDACRAAMLAAAPQPQNAPQNIPEIIPNELIAAVNRLFDSNGSRGCYNAIKCYDAHIEVERLLAVARQEVNHG